MLGLDVGLVPDGVLAQSFGFGEYLAFRELDMDRGQHRPPVARVGPRVRGLIARPERRAVGPVAGEDVFYIRHRTGYSTG